MELIASLLINVVPFLVLLTILVFVHELGHYVVARYNGVKVEVFSIGFGRKLFGWRSKDGTHWKVSLIPLGGYIKMANENEVFATEKDAEKPDLENISQDSLLSKTVWQRMAISAAGPGANYLFAFLMLIFVYVTYGQRIVTPGAVIEKVHTESVAGKAGILPQDKVLEADGHIVHSVEDFQKAIASHIEKELTLKIERPSSQQPLTVVVQPSKVEVGGKIIGRLGVELAPAYYTTLNTPIEAVKNAAIDLVSITTKTLTELGQMLVGNKSPDGLTGPIGIASLTGKVAQLGLGELLRLAALLSLNLGLINLFPIPVLDGGHILFYLIEWVRGKPVPEKAQEFIFKIGFVIILGLIVVSFWNDLSRLKFFQWILGFFH
jgi:regulator of sigma E protease